MVATEPELSGLGSPTPLSIKPVGSGLVEAGDTSQVKGPTAAEDPTKATKVPWYLHPLEMVPTLEASIENTGF